MASTRARGHQILRRSIPESLRDSLRERILSGELAEGEALVQDAIAEEYDVSRMPVREALRQLEAMGLVTMQTHKGAIVTTIPTEEIEELFDLRAMLECDLLDRSIPHMADHDLAEARLLLDRLDASYAQDDMANWGRLNWEFHQRLYLPSRRKQTLALLQGINLQTERYVRIHLALTQGLDKAQQEHRDLLRLCALREAEAGVTFLRDHIRETGRVLVAALREKRSCP